MNRFTHWLPRAGMLTLTLLLLNACGSNGQSQSSLDSPEWQEFRTLTASYDSMIILFAEMEKENPEFAKDPQAFLGPEIQRYYALIQNLSEAAPKDFSDLDDFDRYSYQDLRVIKLAALVTQQMPPVRTINTRLLTLVQDADSIRDIKLESAQLALMAGDFSEAESYATEDVLAAADPMQRGTILSSFSQSFYDQDEKQRARDYALKAVKAFGEELRNLEGTDASTDAYKQQTQWLKTRTAEVLAPLMYDLKESGDSQHLDAFIAEVKQRLPASANWSDMQSSINEAMGEIADEREALGRPAKEWEEHIWLGSDPLSVADLKGKVVLIDFFATWCQPCIVAFPYLRDWQEKYGDQGLVIVGLTTYQGRYDGSSVKPDEELTRLKDDFIPKHDVTWPVGVEKSGRQTMLDYNVQGIPHLVLVDRAGKVQYVKVGAAEFDKTERKIKQLLSD